MKAARAADAMVLDSWAVLAWLGDEPSAAVVEELLIGANRDGRRILLGMVNAAEIWCVVARRVSEAAAEDLIGDLIRMKIQLVEVDWKISRTAASFKTRYRMSLGDVFAAALAHHEGGELITGDPEFRQVERDIRIRWV